MKKSISGILSGVAAIALFATGIVHAQETTSWSATSTKATNVESVAYVSDMKDGDTIQIGVALQLRNKAQLDAIAKQVMLKQSSRLTTSQMQESYWPSSDQVQSVVKYLERKGFINIVVSPDNLMVKADGTASTVNAAFHTKMQYFNVDGRIAHANTADVVVPQELSGTVMSVLGLQDVYVPKPHLVEVGESVKAAAVREPHYPSDFPTIYGASSLPSAASASINIIAIGNVAQTQVDLKAFAVANGYPAPNLQVIYLDCLSNCVAGVPTVGSQCSSQTASNGVNEANLDTQAALAAAGGTVRAIYIYSTLVGCSAAMTETYRQAILQANYFADIGNVNQVLNISLGTPEAASHQDGSMAADDSIFELGVAGGMTITASSGDSGAWIPSSVNASTQTVNFVQGVSYPATSPYVIAVGGTSLFTNGTTGYGSETGWSCTSEAACISGGGSGGGPSAYEAAPSWQSASGTVTGTSFRAVPDVAFSSDAGAYVLINGSYKDLGGTSLSAPLFAGFWARIQSEHLTKSTTLLPSPGPRIYTLGGAHSTAFNKITSGSDGIYSVPASGAWNFVTGYGSFNVYSLYLQL